MIAKLLPAERNNFAARRLLNEFDGVTFSFGSVFHKGPDGIYAEKRAN